MELSGKPRFVGGNAMKTSLVFSIIGLVAAMCLSVSPVRADQWQVVVPDAGFDDHVLANVGDWISISDVDYTGPWESPGSAWIDRLYWASEGWTEDLPAKSGNNKAYGDYDYLYQILDERFIEGGTYTLTVWVGQAWIGYDDNYSLCFTGEDYTNNLIEKHGYATVEDWGLESLSYTATAADAGKRIGIKMYGDEYVTFEDVTLSYNGPPAPPMATNPVPGDGVRYESDSVVLAWIGAAGAAQHDIYFGTDFDAVNDATASEPPVDPYKGRQAQAEVSYDVTDLVPGTTYYWRIDEVEADGTIEKGTVWSFWLAPLEAFGPRPADGEMYVDLNADLRWGAGYRAIIHEVFFGTDPGSLTSIYKSGPNTCDPGVLLKDMTYYWQVKEYRPNDGDTVGPIWSFSTTLSTQGTILYEHWDGIEQVEPAYDESLDSLRDWPDYPSSPTGSMERTLFEGPTDREEDYGARMRAWLYVPVTGDYKFRIVTDNNGELYLSSDDRPANATLIATCGVGWAAPRDWNDGDVTESESITLVAGQKYYIEGLMKERDGGDNIAVGWTTPLNGTIEVIPGRYLEPFVQWWAWDPSPADEAPEVSRPITLRWRAGSHAGQHQVYFGESEGTMTLRQTLSLGTEEYTPPETLEPGQTYYWKVTEVKPGEPGSPWEGDLWSFTIAEYFVVDDMANYGDLDEIGVANGRAWYVWRDGEGWITPAHPDDGGNGTGSVVDWYAPEYYQSRRALWYSYDSDGLNILNTSRSLYYSEVTARISDLPIGSDWTAEGVKSISLHFFGAADNDTTEQLYVKLNDRKVLYDGDMADVAEESWHEWNIVLSQFDTNLQNVTEISIGFGDENNKQPRDARGVVLFDDIRLHIPRCVLAERDAAFAEFDFAGDDCTVNHLELEQIAETWLVEWTDPGTDNLVGWWKLDDGAGTTAQDSSIHANHGTLTAMNPASDWVAGQGGTALYFDGTDDYIDCGNNSSLQITGTQITVAAWIKWEVAEEWSAIAMKTSSGDWTDGYGLYAQTDSDSVNFYVGTYGARASKPFSADNQWHHVVGTYDGSHVRIWVDGVEGIPRSYTGSITDADHSFEIGRGADDAYNFRGTVDDVRVYNVALTGTDVLGLLDLPSDLNEDLKVDFKDYAALATVWLDEVLWP